MTDVTDDFNRANGPLGSNWLDSPGFTGGTMDIASNAFEVVGSQWRIAYWNPSANTFSSDQYAQAKFIGGDFAGVVVRHQPGSSSGYFWINNGGIYRFDNGVFGSIAASSASPVLGDVMRLEIVGSTLTCKINGVPVGTCTDTAYTGGSPGLGATQGGPVPQLDDWLGGPIVLPVITGIAAATEAVDAFAGVGAVTILAMLAATEASDVFAATCAVAFPAIFGAMAATEVADLMAAAGQITTFGALAALETADAFAGSGATISLPITGLLAAVEAPDCFMSGDRHRQKQMMSLYGRRNSMMLQGSASSS